MNMNMRNKMAGITLLELMIVVVIVAMLAALSYPNYREYVARAKRNEAKAALLKCATNQEKLYLQNQTFTNDLSLLGFASNMTDSGTYQISVGGANLASNFTCTATYQRTDDEANKCNAFTIDSTGTKTSSPYTDCWTRQR